MAKDYGALVLKNYQIQQLLGFLNVPLSGQTARARNRMAALIEPDVHKIEEVRQELLTKYCVLDEKKERVIENGKYKLTDMEAFTKEYDALMETEVTYKILPSQLMDFKVLKDVVMNTEEKMNRERTVVYDEICTVLEALNI